MQTGRLTITQSWHLMMKRRGNAQSWSISCTGKYEATLGWFLDFLKTQTPFIFRQEIYADQLTEDHVIDFMARYHEKSHGHHDGILTRLSVYSKFLQEEGIQRKILTRDIARRKQGIDDTVHEPIALNVEDLFRVADAAGERHISRKYLVLVQFFGGLRAGEVTRNLKVGGVRFKQTNESPMGSYRFWAEKGKKFETQPLSGPLRDILLDWFDVYLELAKQEGLLPAKAEELPDDWYLFPTTFGVGSSPKGGKRKLKINPHRHIAAPDHHVTEALKDVGLYEPWMSTHSLRRGGAIYLLSVTGDMNVVKTYLRHQNIKTTYRYTGRELEKVALTNALADLPMPGKPADIQPEPEDSRAEVVVLAQYRRAK